jgi:NHL repeat
MQKEYLQMNYYIFITIVLLCSIIAINNLQNKTLAQDKSSSIISYRYAKQWGLGGSDPGQFLNPSGVTVDSKDNVYVTDDGNSRIQKFDSNGDLIKILGFNDTGNIQINNPGGIAIDSKDNVYVTDYNSNTVSKFNSNGNYILNWKTSNPEDITVDSKDNVYVTNYIGVVKFDSNGNLVAQWGSYGSGNGQFIGSNGIAVNSSGNVYVTDGGNNRIQLFVPVISANNTKELNQNTNITGSNNNNTLLQPGINTQI